MATSDDEQKGHEFTLEDMSRLPSNVRRHPIDYEMDDAMAAVARMIELGSLIADTLKYEASDESQAAAKSQQAETHVREFAELSLKVRAAANLLEPYKPILPRRRSGFMSQTRTFHANRYQTLIKKFEKMFAPEPPAD